MGMNTNRKGALIFEWPDFVADLSLGGSVANPLPRLSQRGYQRRGQFYLVSGANICKDCGHWEATWERMVGLGSGPNGCLCCRARAGGRKDADAKQAREARERDAKAASKG